jgi:hypothetical protein
VPGVRGEGVKKKRWTLKLALCLLAGAVVTWGVAWGCALWGQNTVPYPDPLPTERTFALRTETAINGSPGEFIEFDVSFGVPCRALISKRVWFIDRYLWQLSKPQTALDQLLRLLRPSDGFDGRFPTRILPLGFALNTLFYAAVLLGTVEGVAFARRRVRRGKGRCPSCGYDRAGLAEGSACPECGAGAAGG